MLQIDKVDTLEGVQVFCDDTQFNVFYLLPQQPRYRLDETTRRPVFKFLKYRMPVDRPDGKKGGGFFIFDAEFVVDETKLGKIRKTLEARVQSEASRRGIQAPPMRLGTLTYTSGEVQLNIATGSGAFVEKIFNAGVPSLYGNNIATFSAELTPEGATFFEQALQGLGGSVAVVYKLKFWAKLPPMKVHAWFNSSQFYSFYQTIDVEWRLWDEDDYRETVRESLITSQSMGVDVDPGGITDDKLKSQVRDWAFQTLEKQIEKKMIDIVSPVPEDQRKQPENIENVTRDIQKTQISSFNLNYKEAATVEWFVAPQGTLPNITNLTGADGKPLKWADYAVTVDLDDPFFKQLRVDTLVNADFEHLPIHSVEVKVLYNGRPMANLAPNAPEGEVVLKKPDDVGHFATFVENDNWKYKYSYQVNYKGMSQIFQSPEIETNEGNLTIGVDDVGILTIDVAAGDINWTQVQSAQVKLTYEDREENIELLEDQFILSEQQPTHLFQKVIFKPFRKSYKYQVKYFMKDGKEFVSGEQDGRAKNVFINDPFSGSKTVKIIAAGDLQNKIANIFVDVTYTDDQNKYTQSKPVALSATTPFFDWAFPVINETAGKITYSGNVVLKDGTVRPIAPMDAEGSTIIVPKPPVGSLEVNVVTDLLNFSDYQLVQLLLKYEDADNFISERQNYVFSPTKKEQAIWRLPIFNAGKKRYTWEATFFMNDNTEKKIGAPDTDNESIVLKLP